MNIIGLSGYARTGKDEAANVLVEEFGFIRVAYADKLREVLYALNPIVSFKGWKMHSETAFGEPKLQAESYVTVQDVIAVYGWEGYKNTEYSLEIRRLLQRLGTEAGRQTLWDSIWVDATFAGLEGENIVITDVRFVNEAEAVSVRGGEVWRVTRDGVGPTKNSEGVVHKSETGLDHWHFDAHINNHSSIEEYRELIRREYAEFVQRNS